MNNKGIALMRSPFKFVIDKSIVRTYNTKAVRGINSVVECHLAKVKVASSNLVSRSNIVNALTAPQSERYSFYEDILLTISSGMPE